MQEGKPGSQTEPVLRWEILASTGRPVEDIKCEHSNSSVTQVETCKWHPAAPQNALLWSLEAGDGTDWHCLGYKLALTYSLTSERSVLQRNLKKKKLKKKISVLICGIYTCSHDLCSCRQANPDWEQAGTEAEGKADLTCPIFVNTPERKSHCV